MAVNFTRLDDGGVLINAIGVVSGDELIDIQKTILGSEKNEVSYKYQITDLTGVENFDVSPDHLRTISDHDKKAAELNPNMIIAVVCNQDVICNLSKMWQAFNYKAPLKTKLLDSIDSAKVWIADNMNNS